MLQVSETQRYLYFSDTGIIVNDMFTLKGELSFLWKRVHNSKGKARTWWPPTSLRILRRLWQQTENHLFFRLHSDDQMFLARAMGTNEQTTAVMLQSNTELSHLTSLQQKLGSGHHICLFN